MKWILCGAVAVAAALVTSAPARAGDIQFRPIDTEKLVVKPTRVVADLVEKTINLMGVGTANSIDSNGYVRTINNLFSFKRIEPKFQTGPSPLPSPNLFPSTKYPNYNQPVAPIYQTWNR